MHDPIARFTRNLLCYGQDIHAVADAAEAAPRDAQLNAFAAATALFGMTPASHEAADPYLDRAQSAATGRAERALVDAVQAWRANDRPAAIVHFRRRLELRPDDLATSKLCQLLHLDLGDFAGMVDTIETILPHHRGNHYVIGQLAFALEEAGEPQRAADFARRAVDQAQAADADDPWSIHALLHVHHRRGERAAIIALVRRHAPLWERCGTFMALHAWWHAALAMLDLDDLDGALAVYDAHIGPSDPACVQSLVARVSLLERLRLRGVDVRDRWPALETGLGQRAADGINGFLDVHYAYGLARTGAVAEARAAIEGLDGLAAAAARALVDHASGNHDAAACALAALRPLLVRLGGSREQRQLYELIELDAALAAGRREQALALLRDGGAVRPAWQDRLEAELPTGERPARRA
ncbi:hypothetical protein [uncultured Novosphingobium sp.]|uniref:hypothetical protein n=1 Tax=uncultured Novosphingobium sp. TaxID=292277 RepID=UPI00258414DC|nr:hypothetical protein [uncultured Novosphingobium sp.]